MSENVGKVYNLSAVPQNSTSGGVKVGMETDVAGLLKGADGEIAQAVPGEDYLTPDEADGKYLKLIGGRIDTYEGYTEFTGDKITIATHDQAAYSTLTRQGLRIHRDASTTGEGKIYSLVVENNCLSSYAGEPGGKAEPAPFACAVPTQPSHAVNKEYVDALAEEMLPYEDPGFTGMLWSEDENGNGVQAMAGYDAGDGNKTSYLSIYREGASADFGVSEGENVTGEKVPFSYLTLQSVENGGSVEAQVSKDGAEFTLRYNAKDQFYRHSATLYVGNNANGKNVDAILMFDDKGNPAYSEQSIEFEKCSEGGVYVRGIKTPMNLSSELRDYAATKGYVDDKIQYGTAAPSKLDTGSIFLVYE